MRYRSVRYFILGPLIILLAFTLPSTPFVILQILGGLLYTSLGFLWLTLDKKP